MDPIARLGACAFSALVIFTALNSLASPRSRATATESANTCTAPDQRQLDFWIGDWDVFDVDNPTAQVARVRVDRILDGCVLREDYQDSRGHKGQSLSIYDLSRKVWHQSWVTNRGELLVIEGECRHGEMVLNGEDAQQAGKRGRFAEPGGWWRQEFVKPPSPQSMVARHGVCGSTFGSAPTSLELGAASVAHSRTCWVLYAATLNGTYDVDIRRLARVRAKCTLTVHDASSETRCSRDQNQSWPDDEGSDS